MVFPLKNQKNRHALQGLEKRFQVWPVRHPSLCREGKKERVGEWVHRTLEIFPKYQSHQSSALVQQNLRRYEFNNSKIIH
jgi:hypothetical protein